MAMTKLPKGTGAITGSPAPARATTGGATSKVPAKHNKHMNGSHGKNIGFPKGTKPVTQVGRASATTGGGNSSVPATNWPSTNKRGGPAGTPKSRGSSLTTSPHKGAVSSGGGSFGQN